MQPKVGSVRSRIGLDFHLQSDGELALRLIRGTCAASAGSSAVQRITLAHEVDRIDGCPDIMRGGGKALHQRKPIDCSYIELHPSDRIDERFHERKSNRENSDEHYAARSK